MFSRFAFCDRTMRSPCTRLVILFALAMVLGACQTMNDAAQVPETGETLTVTVQPSNSTTDDLEGQTITGSVRVTVRVEGWMRSVRFYLNGALIRTLTNAPYEITLDTTTLVDGEQTLGIEARMANDRVRASQTVSFLVANDSIDTGRGYALRGDPNFSVANLSPEQRALYDAFLLDILDPNHLSSARSDALSDDLFTYGRGFGGHLRSVLIAFRLTGDLRLLDYVDEMAQLMRSRLADGWRGTNDGTDGTRDGYLNWVYRYSATPSYQGKDTRAIDDMQAHAVVAMFAYAFEANRHLASPAGVDYGERADFWKDYLVNTFEAKWRERNDVPHGFPFITKTQTTVFYNWTAWHYYMWRLTGIQAYGDEATKMARATNDELRQVDTSSGTAYVWGSGLIQLGDSQTRLQPTNYTSTVYGLSVDLHLENFDAFASAERLQRMTRAFSHFVMDTNDPIRHGFAPDLGGGAPLAGLHSDPSTIRRTIEWYRASQVPLIAAWDTTSRIPLLNAATKQSTSSSRAATAISVGLLLDSVMRPTTAQVSTEPLAMAPND